MKLRKPSVRFCGLGIALLCLWFSIHAANAQILLPDPTAGSSKPFDGQTNVQIEKGKRPGLLFHFKCVNNMGQPTNGCFPLAPTATATLAIGYTGNLGGLVCLPAAPIPPLTCTPGITPTPGACSYTVVDGVVAGDTIKIIYDGTFPKTQPIDYSVTGAHNVPATVIQSNNNPHDFRFCSGTDIPKTISVELVFDISGSMALFTTSLPGATLTRMQALKDAAQILLAPGADLDSFAIPGDKLGVAFFSTNANPDPTVCAGTTNLVGADNPVNVSNVSTLIQGQNPTASTSIGAGLQSANKCGFVNEPAPQNANKQVWLFSDGAQNTAPNVVFPVVNNKIQIVDSLNNVTDYPANINICPITVGPLGTPANALQQAIADTTCGGRNAHSLNSNQTFTAPFLETYFAQSLAAIFPTDKLEIVADTTGTIARGTTAVEKFLVSPDD